MDMKRIVVKKGASKRTKDRLGTECLAKIYAEKYLDSFDSRRCCLLDTERGWFGWIPLDEIEVLDD